jgi:L-fuculose-phosphate aldolase
VVHAHPVHCTALAVHGRGIGPFHYMVALAGGRDIRCAGYATFGTQELSDLVIEALCDRKACLMAHHGLIACGADLDRALALAVEVETLAAQYLAALQLGEPPELTDAQMDDVLAKVARGYGYGSGPDSGGT